MHENWDTYIFCPMDKKMLSDKTNGVLENVLVCVHFSLKLAIVTAIL